MTPEQLTREDSAFGPNGNRLLALLSAEDAARWHLQLEQVDLSLGQVLSESGSPPAYVYFPTTAIVSLLYTTAEGDCSEIAVVGCDGLVGISVFMGGNATPSQAVVQSAGLAWRLSARAVREERANVTRGVARDAGLRANHAGPSGADGRLQSLPLH